MKEIAGFMMEFVTGHWLSLAVGIFLLAMVLYGHYRGFLRMALPLAALILSILAVRMATPYMAAFLKENTPVQEMIRDAVSEAAGLGEDTKGPDQPVLQESVIQGLELPPQMKELLLENNNDRIYELLGVDTFVDYVGAYLADMVLRAIGAVVLFLVVYVALRLIIHGLDLIARLPILYGMNQIAGALLGGLRGLLWLWGACLVVDFFSHTGWATAVLTQVQNSLWLRFLYQNNWINWLFVSILRSLV